MAESVELPSRLGILPFRNKVLLPGAIIRIRCTSPSRFSLALSLSLSCYSKFKYVFDFLENSVFYVEILVLLGKFGGYDCGFRLVAEKIRERLDY